MLMAHCRPIPEAPPWLVPALPKLLLLSFLELLEGSSGASDGRDQACPGSAPPSCLAAGKLPVKTLLWLLLSLLLLLVPLLLLQLSSLLLRLSLLLVLVALSNWPRCAVCACSRAGDPPARRMHSLP